MHLSAFDGLEEEFREFVDLIEEAVFVCQLQEIVVDLLLHLRGLVVEKVHRFTADLVDVGTRVLAVEDARETW
jgi:hypothetical protein